VSKRRKMPMSERAKIFQPFNPLRGLAQARAAAEKVPVPEAEISPERMAQINETLQRLEKRCMVTVIYYDHLQQVYLKKEGMLAAISPESRFLQVGGVKIPIDDLYDIEINSFPEKN
jgi:hypothetical protein